MAVGQSASDILSRGLPVPLPPRLTAHSSPPASQQHPSDGDKHGTKLAIAAAETRGAAEKALQVALTRAMSRASSMCTSPRSPPETPHWGITPSTDFGDDAEAASDNEISGAMSFDGESQLDYQASLASEEVIEIFLQSRARDASPDDEAGPLGHQQDSIQDPLITECLQRELDFGEMLEAIRQTECVHEEPISSQQDSSSSRSCDACVQMQHRPISGAVARAVAKVAESRLGIGVVEEVRAAATRMQVVTPLASVDPDDASAAKAKHAETTVATQRSCPGATHIGKFGSPAQERLHKASARDVTPEAWSEQRFSSRKSLASFQTSTPSDQDARETDAWGSSPQDARIDAGNAEDAGQEPSWRRTSSLEIEEHLQKMLACLQTPTIPHQTATRRDDGRSEIGAVEKLHEDAMHMESASPFASSEADGVPTVKAKHADSTAVAQNTCTDGSHVAKFGSPQQECLGTASTRDVRPDAGFERRSPSRQKPADSQMSTTSDQDVHKSEAWASSPHFEHADAASAQNAEQEARCERMSSSEIDGHLQKMLACPQTPTITDQTETKIGDGQKLETSTARSQRSTAVAAATDLQRVLDRLDKLVHSPEFALAQRTGDSTRDPEALLSTPIRRGGDAVGALGRSAHQVHQSPAALQCPQGHDLLPTHGKVGRQWICDGCDRLAEVLTASRYRCAVCDYDLCECCAAASPPARAASSNSLPISPQVLNNQVVMPLMKCTETLGKAYQYLEEVNDFNLQLHGVLLPEAVYNQACCLSLGADALLSSGRTASPGLPPLALNTLDKELVEDRLGLAVDKLNAAVLAGYSDAAHMREDLDLQAMRELRPAQFSWVLAKLRARGK